MEVFSNREETKRAAVLAMMTGTTVNLVGQTGVGKTMMAEEIAKEYGRKLFVLNSAINNTEDLIGIPYIDKKKNETHWTKPFWWPTDGNYVILIDEINRADKSTLNALLPFILNGSLHEHTLPKGVWVITAQNPDTDDYDLVNSFDDRAIFSRMCILNVGLDTLSWKKWLTSTNRHTKYLEEVMVNTLSTLDKKLVTSQVPNPRSFAKMIDIINVAKKYNEEIGDYYFTDEVVLVACGGIVGNDFVSNNSSAIIEEFLNEKEKTLDEILDSEVDVSNVLKVKEDLRRELLKPIEDKKVMDKLYKFISTNGVKFPGHFIDILRDVTGPNVNFVNEMIIKLKNEEAKMYNVSINKEDN